MTQDQLPRSTAATSTAAADTATTTTAPAAAPAAAPTPLGRLLVYVVDEIDRDR